MTEIRFYHLSASPLEKALPALLLKVLEAGHRAVVLVKDEVQLKALDQALWTFSTKKLVPHGTAEDEHPEQQPVYLTVEETYPNGADVLVVTDGRMPEMPKELVRCLDMFDGQNEAEVGAARARWKEYQEVGAALAYWKQDAKGQWVCA